MTLKSVPNEAEWRSVYWCLDIPYAYEHFFGKTLPEAIQLFEENALNYVEDLTCMPTPCLDYYIDAYITYLLSESSQGDSDGASCFYGLIECRHEDIQTFSEATIEQVRKVLQRLASHQDWYEASPDIYGDFERKSMRTLELLR